MLMDRQKHFKLHLCEFRKLPIKAPIQRELALFVFGRIGSDVRQKLLMITPLGAINSPIQVKLRQYEDGVVAPIYERRLYVNKNGININADSVSIQLSVNNPAKLTNEGAFYDPDVWTGLRTL